MRIYAQNLPLFSKAIKQKIYSLLQIRQKALGHSNFYRKLFAINTTESVQRSQIIAGIAYWREKNIGPKTRRANRAQRSNAQDKRLGFVKLLIQEYRPVHFLNTGVNCTIPVPNTISLLQQVRFYKKIYIEKLYGQHSIPNKK